MLSHAAYTRQLMHEEDQLLEDLHQLSDEIDHAHHFIHYDLRQQVNKINNDIKDLVYSAVSTTPQQSPQLKEPSSDPDLMTSSDWSEQFLDEQIELQSLNTFDARALDNTRELHSGPKSIKAFLHDEDLHLNFQPINLNKDEQSSHINIQHDVDGIVVEMDSFAGIKIPMHFITSNPDLYINIYHDIKKHVVNNDAAKHSFGQRLATVDGYRLMIGIVPESSSALTTWDGAYKKCSEIMKCFWGEFNQLLLHIPDADKARRSVRKNLTGKNNQSINIIPVDQAFYMSLLDRALSSLTLDSRLLVKIYAVKFGMKDRNSIQLEGIFDHISKVSIHCAAELSSLTANVHLFWAKEGIRQLVGNRGKIFSCLSINEAMNYQSNVDGRALDIKPELRRTCNLPQNLNFIQLYTDTPHTRGQSLWSHPITGKIYIIYEVYLTNL